MLLISLSGLVFAAKSDEDDKDKNKPTRPAPAARPEPRRVDPPRPVVARPEPRRVDPPKPVAARPEPRREVRVEPRRVAPPKPTVTQPEPRVVRTTAVVAKPEPITGKSFAMADPPKGDDKPDRDKPRRDQPRVDPPRRDIPKVELPRREVPKVDPPRREVPKVDPPRREVPKVDPPRREVPKIDPPRRETPKVDPPKVDVPKVTTPKIDPPKIDQPKIDSPKFTPPDTMPHKVDPSRVKPRNTDGQPTGKETDDERLRRRGFERRPNPDTIKQLDVTKPIDRAADKTHADDPKRDARGPGIVNPGIINPGGGIPGVGPRSDDKGKHPDLVLPGRPDTRDLKPDRRPIDPAEAARHNFAERVKGGQIDHLTNGKVAEQLNLRNQYKMFGQGDVARRMDLEHHVRDMQVNNVTNVHVDNHLAQIYRADRPYYHGVVAQHYTRDCFRYNYWGPSYFAGVCWYPNWLGWVDWSWHHHIHPLYDPRPIWCRPVIYAPAPVWVYYQAPVWQPLPTVACGTWVDVQAEVVRDSFDLQLLAVRFVDPGHPQENLGPRYRVWFRNNSDKPINTPFNVTAFAANDEKLVEGVPQAGVRVTSIDAGGTQSVDIRLPVEAMSLGRDQEGKPTPFAMLHVIVDANREIEDSQRVNNGVRIKTQEVLPVDPVTFIAKPTSAAAGDEVVLAGEGFGPLPGQVIVRLGDLELDAEILGWYDLGVRFTLPKVPLAKQAEAEVIVVRGDSAAANPVNIAVTPPRAAEATKSEGPQLH